jgi:hypothetical protein
MSSESRSLSTSGNDDEVHHEVLFDNYPEFQHMIIRMFAVYREKI